MIGESRRVRIDVAYDGTDFAGWQFQPRLRTVQGELERVLTRLQGERPARVRAAGRTDAGVHARGQVVDLLYDGCLDDEALLHALRRLLPADMRAFALCTVAPDFDARGHARSKTYRYHIDRSRSGDPFVRRFALHYVSPLDPARIRQSTEYLPGRRDWSGFAGAACNVRNRVREMTAVDYHETGTEAHFMFTANGFLNHMVRNLVGTLLDVGRGRFEPNIVREVLESRDRRMAGPTAPAHGLVLDRVDY